MTDTSKLAAEAAAISTSSSKIRTFAIDAAANLVDLAGRLAVLEAEAAAPAPVTPTTSYLFHDEFDGPAGTAPDPAKWINLDGIYYDQATSRAKAKNAFLDGNGNLILRITREAWCGKSYAGALIGSYRYQTGWPPSPVLASWPLPFRYEVRFKLPNVAGAWCGPGWIQNVDHTVAQGLWELDCGETRSTFPTVFGANQHHWTLDSTGKEVDTYNLGAHGTGSDGRSNWHVMRCDADTVSTRYYLDAAEIVERAPADGKFGVLLHNVIADLTSWGSGNAQPDPADPGPWDMPIDYIRVWALQ